MLYDLKSAGSTAYLELAKEVICPWLIVSMVLGAAWAPCSPPPPARSQEVAAAAVRAPDRLDHSESEAAQKRL